MMSHPHPPPGPNDIGLRLVIFYKLTKGVIWLTLALVFAFGARYGLAERLQDWISTIHSNATHLWSIRLTEKLFTIISKKHILLFAAIALTLDGALTTLEGWALHHRKRWGEWLVVVATGSLLPVELYEIVRAVRVTRIVILLINVWIVIYLARRIKREHAVEHPRKEPHAPAQSEAPAEPLQGEQSRAGREAEQVRKPAERSWS